MAVLAVRFSYQIFFLFIVVVDVFQIRTQFLVFLFSLGQPDFNQLLFISDMHLQIESHSLAFPIFLIFPALYTAHAFSPPAGSPAAEFPRYGEAPQAPGASD